MKKLLKTALLSLTLSTGLTLSTLALAGDADFIADICGSDSACVTMMKESFAMAEKHSAAIKAEAEAAAEKATAEAPGFTISGPDVSAPGFTISGPDVGSKEEAAEEKAARDTAASEKDAFEARAEDAKTWAGESGDSFGGDGVSGVGGFSSTVTHEEYEKMTDLEREIHDEGRELSAEERANLKDFNSVDDAVLKEFEGLADPTALAKAIKAHGRAAGLDVKILYAKKSSGLACFGTNNLTGEVGRISCSETPESLDRCGGAMSSDYKSGIMICGGFTAVKTKIK